MPQFVYLRQPHPRGQQQCRSTLTLEDINAWAKQIGELYDGSKTKASLTSDPIPPDITEKVSAHLRERVGEAFSKQLTFAGGLILNPEKEQRRAARGRAFAYKF